MPGVLLKLAGRGLLFALNSPAVRSYVEKAVMKGLGWVAHKVQDKIDAKEKESPAPAV